MKKYTNAICFTPSPFEKAGVKLKRISLTILSFIFLITSTPLKAQDDANCGIVIDGMLVDKIDCWTFDYMYLVFPVNEKYKKYDLIKLSLRLMGGKKEDNYGQLLTLSYTPQSFSDNFSNGQYGVWKLLIDKNKDAVETGYPITYHKRKDFSVVHNKSAVSPSFAQVELVAYMIEGFEFDVNGNKIYRYGKGSYLYKSKEIPTIVRYGGPNQGGLGYKMTPFDINAACPVTGTKFDLKIEASGAYNEALGIIKGGTSANVPKETANTPKTQNTNTKDASSLPPLETKKSANLIKNKSSTTNVDKFKKADGPYEKKDENGQIEQSGTYKNQKKQGLWKSFENGKLYLEENYGDDVKNGLETKYNDDGGINYKMEFKNGNQNGVEQIFENSKLKSNNTYVSGKKNGKCTSYYSEGGKYSEENYVDGNLDGIKTQYTAKGEISSTTTYKDDKMTGPYKKYSEGKLKEEGTYLNGMQDGVWKKYDKTGKVTETKTYKDGVPQ